jgi:Holliday junction resolvase RusA-like endonuclease
VTPIRIELPGPPRGKGRHRTTRGGITYADPVTRSYEGQLKLAASLAMAGRAPLEGALSVDLVAEMPIPASKSKRWKRDAEAGLIRPTTKPDTDNFIKLIDACNSIVWVDDSQVVTITAMKFYSTRPRLVLIVEPMVDQVMAALGGLAAARENGVAA